MIDDYLPADADHTTRKRWTCKLGLHAKNSGESHCRFCDKVLGK